MQFCGVITPNYVDTVVLGQEMHACMHRQLNSALSLADSNTICTNCANLCSLDVCVKTSAPLSYGANYHSRPMLHAADLPEEEVVLASTSAPNLGLDHSSNSETELEPPSPDIKAFHGDTKSHQHDADSKSADQTVDEDTGPEHSGRGSMEQSRLSTDSATAMPIGRFSQHQHRRPPLRANSTYASRVGMHPRATIKMVSNASAAVEISMHRDPQPFLGQLCLLGFACHLHDAMPKLACLSFPVKVTACMYQPKLCITTQCFSKDQTSKARAVTMCMPQVA